MKNLCFVLFTIFCLVLIAKADTIDYWHVYYNKTKIKEYNQYSKGKTLLLRLDKVKANDLITIKYFRDTPCSDCQTYILVKDEEHNHILTSNGKGTFNPISFILKDLIDFKRKSDRGAFEIYYFEDKNTSNILLFKIMLK